MKFKLSIEFLRTMRCTVFRFSLKEMELILSSVMWKP